MSTAACQAVDSDSEAGDADDLEAAGDDEEALLEAAADVLPHLARAAGLQAFMPSWQVRVVLFRLVQLLRAVVDSSSSNSGLAMHAFTVWRQQSGTR